MQKLLSICGLLAVLGLASLPARAQVAPIPFGGPAPYPQVFPVQPIGPPIFNVGAPSPFSPLYRWQIVTVQVPGQPGTFILLVDAISGTSYILRPNAQEPAGYAWQLLVVR